LEEIKENTLAEFVGWQKIKSNDFQGQNHCF